MRPVLPFLPFSGQKWPVSDPKPDPKPGPVSSPYPSTLSLKRVQKVSKTGPKRCPKRVQKGVKNWSLDWSIDWSLDTGLWSGTHARAWAPCPGMGTVPGQWLRRFWPKCQKCKESTSSRWIHLEEVVAFLLTRLEHETIES